MVVSFMTRSSLLAESLVLFHLTAAPCHVLRSAVTVAYCGRPGGRRPPPKRAHRPESRAGSNAPLDVPWADYSADHVCADAGHAGPAHALGPRVVRAVLGLLRAARRDDGHAPRPQRPGVPSLPSRRTDRDDRRLPRASPRTLAGRRRRSLGRAPVRRSVGHPDGRVPHLRGVTHPQPRDGYRTGTLARPGARGRLHAGSVRTHRADAADPPARRDRASDGVAWRPERDRHLHVPLALARRERGADGIAPARLLERLVAAADRGPRVARDRARNGGPAAAPLRAGRSHRRDGRLRPRRTGCDTAVPARACTVAGGPGRAGRQRRLARAGTRGERRPASLDRRAPLRRSCTPPAERVLRPRAPEARTGTRRGAPGAIRRSTRRARPGVPRAREGPATGVDVAPVERRARLGLRLLARPGRDRRRRPVRGGEAPRVLDR